MNKRTVLAISFTGSLVFLVTLFAKQLGLCSVVNSSCVEIFDPIAENFSAFIPLLLVALITYKVREEVYRTWFRFARIWIPLSMLAILVAPEYSSDWMFSIEKGTVAFFSSVLFVLISLIIVLVSWSTTRK